MVWQGEEATAQIWPTVELPPRTPLTFQAALEFEVPLVWTESVMR